MKRFTKFIAAFLVATMCLSQVQMAYIFADDVESTAVEETVTESVASEPEADSNDSEPASEPEVVAEVAEESEPEAVAESVEELAAEPEVVAEPAEESEAEVTETEVVTEPEVELQKTDEITDSVLDLVGAESNEIADSEGANVTEVADSEGAARTDEKRINALATENTTVTMTSKADGSVVGKMSAIISGVSNPENSELAVKIITNGMPSLEKDGVPLYYKDEYYIDAEKYNLKSAGYDSQLCWAATASNILWMGGYAQGAVNPETGKFFKNEDELFHYFTHNFTDLPGSPDEAVNWFFYGESAYGDTGEKGVAQLKHPGTNSGGLLKNLPFKPQMKLIPQSPNSLNILEELDHYGVGLQLRFLNEKNVPSNEAHWLTVVGTVIDNLATSIGDKFKAILLADSDNTPVNGNMSASEAEKLQAKTNAENRYTLYKVSLKQFGENDYRWVMDGYSKYGTVLCWMYALENNGGKGGPGDCDSAAVEDNIKEQFNQMGIEVEVEKVDNVPENVVVATPNNVEAIEAINKAFDVFTKEQLETEEVINNLKSVLLANDMVVYAPNSAAVSVDNNEIYSAYVASPVTFLAGIETNGYTLGLNEYNLVQLGNGMYKIEFSNEFLKKLPKGKNIIKLRIQGMELPVEIVINII